MKRFPKGFDGLIGQASLREAKAGAFSDILSLLWNAARGKFGDTADIHEVFADRIVFRGEGRYWEIDYSIDESNTVVFGETPKEVVRDYVPIGARMTESVFVEAIATDEGKPARYLVRVIRAGMSGNGVDYPAAVLREAAPRFEGARVFAKSDDEHIAGKGKDVRQLLGRLTKPRFVEAGGGEIQAELDVLEAHPMAASLREAVARDMSDLYGLSIDAVGKDAKRGRYREAKSIDKVLSVDLIVEPGAGGAVIRFTEAASSGRNSRSEDMLREQMLAAIRRTNAATADKLEAGTDNDAEVLSAYREAIAEPAAPAGVAAEQVQEMITAGTRMIEARSYAASAIAASPLPQPAKDRLLTEFRERVQFTEADVDARIKGEGEYLSRFTEAGGGRIAGLGEGSVESGQDVADKRRAMLDDFFDPEKRATSFREAYIQFTGDREVRGLVQSCDLRTLRESVGATRFNEAIASTTWGEALGDAITRAMVREYAQSSMWDDWRDLVDVVPVTDFRTQRRVRIGGYGNLPGVAQAGPYTALTSPADEEATYAATKRGGTETVSLEAIANDDVGSIRRIPVKLTEAAKRTLFTFVLEFMNGNAAIYDTVALFHATHNNLGSTALGAASFAAARLAMLKQAEAGSSQRIGLITRHLYVPTDLEETAFDLFVRDTNNDETFVQSRKPRVHVVPHWTDANNWYATADKAAVQLIELGFYGGREEPELFIQDNPTQGSLFTNDQILYKIRHIYGGAVIDFRGFYGAIVA